MASRFEGVYGWIPETLAWALIRDCGISQEIWEDPGVEDDTIMDLALIHIPNAFYGHSLLLVRQGTAREYTVNSKPTVERTVQ